MLLPRRLLALSLLLAAHVSVHTKAHEAAHSMDAAAEHTRDRLTDHDAPLPSGVNPFKGARLGETWLLPIPLHGPSNQVIGLKEGLVIARQLGRTVVLNNIHDHYTQLAVAYHPVNQPNRNITTWSYFSFEDIFDVNEVSRFTPVVGLRELQASGWNGHVDALLYWDSSDFKHKQNIWRLEATNVSLVDAKRLKMLGASVCAADHADALRTRLEKFRVVAVIIFNRLLEDLRHDALTAFNTSITREADKRCYKLFCAATRRMIKAPLLRQIADQFIKIYLGGEVPYVAVHVRPYPDNCLKQWAVHNLSDTNLQTVCRNPQLHQQIGIQSQMATMRLQKHTQRVFVAAHPQAHAIINASFALEGVTPVYLTSQFVVDAMRRAGRASSSTRISLTYALFVEQEIATRSAIFVGTQDSSISGVIRQERSLRGVPADRSLVFG